MLILDAQYDEVIETAFLVCPKCGAALVERHGRYGIFLGCSSYPKCKFTVNLD